MGTENRQDEAIVLDTSLILRSIRYYAIIGAGLGFLGVIILMQLGGGEGGTGGAIISGLLSLVVLAFAVLSGPIIAAFIGYATAESGIGGPRARSVNSGIANGIGFAIFGLVVVAILWIGLIFVLGGAGDGGVSSGGGSGGPIELGNLINLIILMMIPNALVGGFITFFLGGRGGTSPK